MALSKNTHLHRRTRLRLDDFLPYLINRVGVALVVRFNEQALAGHQLTIDMWRVLAALSDTGRQRQVDLAGMTSIEASTVSRLVTRLVARRLVSRSRSRMNGREVVVELTGRGKALVEQLIPVALSVENSAVGALGARDLARIKQILHRMYGNLTRRRAQGSNGAAPWSNTRRLVGEAGNGRRRAGHHHGGTA
jgi:DNA-binding MarR family transcriptional regulator